MVLLRMWVAAIQGWGPRWCSTLSFYMNAQAFFRTIGFLLILFLVVFVSIENTQVIDFRFSLATEKPVRASAAIIYFAMFAVGVVGGTLLHNSGSKGGARGSDSGGGKKK